MDFFARQEVARRRTWWLVVLFFIAIVGIIASVYGAITLAIGVSLNNDPNYEAVPNPMLSADALLLVSGVVSLIVLGGTAFKLSQLRHGGSKVAEMLGGRLVTTASNQYHERRLLNVVEEMALASGVPVPPVYVMPGQMGINAFAAGYSIHDAVVGVTEGAMRGLKREELQGVIGHEFSHILNGDMRLNIRLIGIVHGLLVLAIVGRVMMRVASGGRSSSSKKDKGAAFFLAIGLALVIIGYAGHFFGGLIKRAVSRQREYLADASAVQFTRNPPGLASALKKVGGLSMGGVVNNAHAEELSHMFFADGIKRLFGGGSLFATHPPLAKRVKLLDPTFNGEFTPLTEDSLYLSGKEDEPAEKKSKASVDGREFIKRTTMMSGVAINDPMTIVHQAGLLDADKLDHAGALLDSMNPLLKEAVRDPLSAQSVLLALLLCSTDGDPSADAWTWLPASFADAVGKYMDMIGPASPRERLALVDLAIPAIRSLSKEQAVRFVELMEKIIRADQRINLFEFALQEIVRSGLREVMNIKVPRITLTKVTDVAKEAGLLISVMAFAGQPDEKSAAMAFENGAGKLNLGAGAIAYHHPEAKDLDEVKEALDRLLCATMPVRKQILEASLACLMSDQTIKPDEFELFRAFAAAMEVPVPPAALPEIAA